MVWACRRVCTRLSRRKRARCWESADWDRPMIRSSSPTDFSPWRSWQRIIKRCSLLIALSRVLARRALSCNFSNSISERLSRCSATGHNISLVCHVSILPQRNISAGDTIAAPISYLD
ncbi:hypothetical protein MTBUT4_330030 [Magnetospirillum sp. UT-4]|nr:hypothetical protein MTBUT4_330030 [Magnetospirillum sp. UT-4]